MKKSSFAQKIRQPAGKVPLLATLLLGCCVLYVQVLQLNLDFGGYLFQVSFRSR